MPTQQYKGLSFTELGPPDADCVVILHGWGSSAAIMSPIANGLAETYRVINIDLPGHGHAPNPRSPMGLANHADAVVNLIQHLHATPVTVVGHSNGGRIALFMASQRGAIGSVVQNMVLIAPSGIRKKRSLGFHIRSLTGKILSAPFKLLPQPARDFTLDWLRHSLVWKLISSSDYAQLEGVMRETFVMLVNSYLEDRLTNISCPTLLIWGTNDEAIDRRQIDTLVNGIEDCGLVELPNENHFGFLKHIPTVVQSTRHLIEGAKQEKS